MVEIENVKVEYLIEYTEKRIHLLERGNSGFSHSLANKISPQFQQSLIEEELLLSGLIDFEWVLYCSSCLVMTYKEYSLNLVVKNEKWLHAPFLDVIQNV